MSNSHQESVHHESFSHQEPVHLPCQPVHLAHGSSSHVPLRFPFHCFDCQPLSDHVVPVPLVVLGGIQVERHGLCARLERGGARTAPQPHIVERAAPQLAATLDRWRSLRSPGWPSSSRG